MSGARVYVLRDADGRELTGEARELAELGEARRREAHEAREAACAVCGAPEDEGRIARALRWLFRGGR